jgi:hypothetical protein
LRRHARQVKRGGRLHAGQEQQQPPWRRHEGGRARRAANTSAQQTIDVPINGHNGGIAATTRAATPFLCALR